MKTVVELYRWEGKWLFFTIPTECEECNVLTAYVKGLKKKYPDVTVRIKPWFNEWPRLLFTKGAWHAPILMLNGKVFSQGIVPDLKKFEEELSSSS